MSYNITFIFSKDTEPDGKKGINTLRPCGTILHYESLITLVQVMVCCLITPNHFLTNIDLSSIIHRKLIQNDVYKISTICPGSNELIGPSLSHISSMPVHYQSFISNIIPTIWNRSAHSSYSADMTVDFYCPYKLPRQTGII